MTSVRSVRDWLQASSARLAERHTLPSQRLRQPQPVLRTRLPSGRGAMEQPNASSDGEAALTPTFWLALVITGIAAGLTGSALIAVLVHVQMLAFHYSGGGFEQAVERSSALRRVSSLLIAGAFGGVAWFLVRRYTKGPGEPDDVLWSGRSRLAFWRPLLSGLVSEVVIGMGASIGREAAPKTMGAVWGSVSGGWLGLSAAQRRLLIACGGGAGLASVYNVPLGGAFFTAEILLGGVTISTMLPALACAWIATATAWVYLPDHAIYSGVPDHRVSVSLIVWSLIAGPLIGVFATGYIRLIGTVSHWRPKGRWAIVAPVVGFGILGAVGIAYPQLFGNGQDMASDAFLGHGSIGLFFALAFLKPIMTTICLGSGASGGLFTPVLSTGAVLGAALGLAWTYIWPGSPVGAFAMIGASAMIGSAMQAPITALALVLELTDNGFGIMVPMIAATVAATFVVRYLDGYSIYSARLPAIATDSSGGLTG